MKRCCSSIAQYKILPLFGEWVLASGEYIFAIFDSTALKKLFLALIFYHRLTRIEFGKAVHNR